MKYLVDLQKKQPSYLQLYQQIKADIIEGVYPYKSKLPSKRVIANDVGLSIVTVEHAYSLLCDEGYIEPVQRSGYFVIFRASDYFTASSEPEKIALPHHNNVHTTHEFPFSILTKTMRKVMNDYGEAILTKSPNCGCIELRTAISKYLLRSRGIHADIGQIIIGSGAEYLYGLVVELLGLNLVYGVESPSYEKIEKVYKASGAKYEMLTLNTDGIDSYALANTNASVLHITPYRSYPSGITATASKRYEYISWVKKENRFIVEDDFESEFSVSRKPEETLFSLSGNKNVIYMNTFSKTISPSLRIGYMVLPQCLVQAFEDKLGFYSCTVPTFEQFVIAELITNGDFERHINRVRRNKRKELEKSKL